MVHTKMFFRLRGNPIIRLWRIVLFGLNQKEPKSSRPGKNLLKITPKIALEVNSLAIARSDRLLACDCSRDFLHANF
jgi:hypothetical protein